MIVIVFGVSGAGKTTIGELLARELEWHFYEADDFHSAANIEKLLSGRRLTDEDRWPWLEKLRELIKRRVESDENAVLACSALKRAYRDCLRVSDEIRFVFLRGDHALIENQLRSRPAHFMNPTLLQSQFDDLQQPRADENVLTIDVGGTPQEIVEEIEAKLHLVTKG